MASQPVKERSDDGTGSEPGSGRTASEPGSDSIGRAGREGLGGTPQGGGGGVEAGPAVGSLAEQPDRSRESEGGNDAAVASPPDSSEVALRCTPLWHAQHEPRYFRAP